MKTVVQDLNSLKYNDLQKLAKSVGIRANQKIEKLIKALTVHYIESESPDKNVSDAEDNTVRGTAKNETGVRSRFSNSHVKSTPLFKAQDEELETPNHTGGRKRRRTFELDEASFHENTPTITADSSPENVSKRQRRSTFDKSSTSFPKSDEKSSKPTSSPSTKAIIEAMDANLSSSERRRRLLSALSKKVQTTVASSSAKSSQPSLIPRFTTFVVNRKNESQKSLTPGNKDWKKIHKKEFSKFDSIDVYLDKKKQRKDQLSHSSKKSLPFGSPSVKTRPAIVKPANKNPESAKIFQPQVTSVKKIDFNFNKMASSCNKKTPARRPSIPGKGGTPTPTSKASLQANVNNKVAGATPFKFTGNTVSAKKTAPLKTSFDLKASLARPLTWKPHTGKLQPLDFNKEETVQTQRLNMRGPTSHRILASKTRSAKVKTEQRAKTVDRRTNQKYMDMMKKRGLLA